MNFNTYIKGSENSVKRCNTAPKPSADRKGDLMDSIRNSGVSSLRKTPKLSPKKENPSSLPFKTLSDLKNQAGKGTKSETNVRPPDLADDLKFALKSFRNKVSGNSNPDVDKDDEDSAWSNSGSSIDKASNENFALNPTKASLALVSEAPRNDISSQKPHKFKFAPESKTFNSAASKDSDKNNIIVDESRKTFNTSNISGFNPTDLQRKSSNIEKETALFTRIPDGSENTNPFKRKSQIKPTHDQLGTENVISLADPAQANKQSSPQQIDVLNPFGLPTKNTESHDAKSTHESSQNLADIGSEMESESKNVAGVQNIFSKYEVVALYDFHGVRSDDLSFNLGDILIVLQEHGEWLYGTSCQNSFSGWFPKNYTEVRMADRVQIKGILSVLSLDDYRVLFNFEAENSNELTIKSGEIVSILKSINENWVIIKNQRGDSGLVPCNYISKFNDQESNSEFTAHDSIPNSASSSSYQDSKVYYQTNHLKLKILDTNDSPKMLSGIPTKLRTALDMAYRSESNDNLAISDFVVTEFSTEEDRKRYEAVREILNTEQKYSDDLNVIIEVAY